MHKRLIEHDLPLADISGESACEKNIRHGHPFTLHIWWARRPLARRMGSAKLDGSATVQRKNSLMNCPCIKIGPYVFGDCPDE